MNKITPNQRNSGQLQHSHHYPEEQKSTFQKIISDRIFLITVFIPTVFAIIYYTFIASGIYISESRFIVRAQSSASASKPIGFSGMLGSIGASLGGLSNSQNDSLTAENYISSRDALNILDSDLDIIQSYSSSKIDRLQRFAGISFWDKSKEAFFNYYRDFIIQVNQDPESGISTLTVRAFDADTAFQINQKLNEISEDLINKLNDRARKDALSFTENEVNIAKKRVEDINQKLFDFRNQNMQSNISTNKQITYYQQLLGEKTFADNNLSTVLASMDTARVELMKKHLFLEKISEPHKPDIAQEPRRIWGIFTVLSLGLLLWGIFSMLAIGVEEHRH